MFKKTLMGVTLAGSLLAQAEAKTWYVDDDNYGKSGLDGKTAETAYGTIQDAINATTTAAGDTILVLPGVYDKGETLPTVSPYSGWGLKHKTRVAIAKNNLTIRSTKGRDVTHIVGARDPEAPEGYYGAWSNAVACITVLWNCATVTIDGFTIRDGIRYRAGLTNAQNSGGGIGYYTGEATGNASITHVFDCVISNCVSYSGAANSCTLHRCLVTGNRALESGGNYSCLTYGKAENSIFMDCAGTAVNRSTLVNCIVIGARNYATANAGTVCNSIFAFNSADCDAVSNAAFTNSVTTGRGCSDATFKNPYNSELHAVATNLFVSPVFRDFRLVAGSCAIGRGDPSCLTDHIVLPDGYVFKDYYGQTIDMAAAHVHAGVSQEVVMPAGGCASFELASGVTYDQVLVDGWTLPGTRGLYAWAETWPVQWCVTAAKPATNPLSLVKDSGGYSHVATADGKVWILPPKADKTKTFTVDCASAFCYVDPVNGSDGYDGSCAWADADPAQGRGPWKTLMNAATNGVIDNAVRTVVRCAPGSYTNGVSNRARLYVPSGRRLHFVGTEGAAKTLIVGAPDPAVSDGRGNDAVRCLHNLSVDACFSGFMLTNGYSTAENDSNEYGGSACLAGATTTLADCQIVGCAARQGVVRGPAAWTVAYLERCLFRDNRGSTCQAQNSVFIGCVLKDNVSTSSYGWFYDAGSVVGSTFYLTDPTTEDQVVNNGNLGVYNTVFVNARGVDKVSSGRGCVFDNCTGAMTGFSDSTTGPAYLARPSSDDYRPTSGSDVCGAAVTDFDSFEKYAGTDYLGNPVVSNCTVIAAGAVVSGAETSVYIDTGDGNVVVSGIPADAHAIYNGETLAFAPDASSARPVVGVVVNDITNSFGQSGSCALTYADVMNAGGTVIVCPVLTSHWYVNPNTDPTKGVVGSNDNTGFSPFFPKRTLKAAVANAVSGDTVHAAEGVYDDETMNAAVSAQPSRVEVPAGVTLVADGIRERTMIRGAAGANADGFGTGAVRCVYLGKGATITGFTISDGHMVSTVANTSIKESGAGICSYAYNGTDVFVNDCLIKNCVAMKSTFLSGTYRNCTIVDCKALSDTFAYTARFYGTLFARNVMGTGSQTHCCNYCGFENVTYASDNVWTTGSPASQNLSATPSFCNNSLVFGLINDCPATNSVFVSDAYTRTKFVNCKTMTAEEVALDANYVPIVGKSKIIDLGTNDCQAVANFDTWGGHDAVGCQRIMNGVIDVGAFEADWRPRYARDVCRRMKVREVSSGATESATHGVLLGANGRIVIDLQRKAGDDVAVIFRFRVDGTGTLTATLDDGTAQTFTATGGVQTLRIEDMAVTSVAFAYVPGVDDTASAELLKGLFEHGCVIVVR